MHMQVQGVANDGNGPTVGILIQKWDDSMLSCYYVSIYAIHCLFKYMAIWTVDCHNYCSTTCAYRKRQVASGK